MLPGCCLLNGNQCLNPFLLWEIRCEPITTSASRGDTQISDISNTHATMELDPWNRRMPTSLDLEAFKKPHMRIGTCMIVCMPALRQFSRGTSRAPKVSSLVYPTLIPHRHLAFPRPDTRTGASSLIFRLLRRYFFEPDCSSIMRRMKTARPSR